MFFFCVGVPISNTFQITDKYFFFFPKSSENFGNVTDLIESCRGVQCLELNNNQSRIFQIPERDGVHKNFQIRV